MTDTVISSVSVIFGAIPTFGRHRLSCGDAFNSSSILPVQCGREGVQIDVHVASMVSLFGNVDHGDSRLPSLPRIPWNNWSSVA